MKKPLPMVYPDGLTPKGEGALSNQDLRSLLGDLKPGWYTVASLWPRYMVWAENEGRSELSRISLGMNLRRIASDSREPQGPGGKLYLIGPEYAMGS